MKEFLANLPQHVLDLAKRLPKQTCRVRVSFFSGEWLQLVTDPIVFDDVVGLLFYVHPEKLEEEPAYRVRVVPYHTVASVEILSDDDDGPKPGPAFKAQKSG